MIRISDLPRSYTAAGTLLVPCQDMNSYNTASISLHDVTKDIRMDIAQLSSRVDELSGLYKYILNVHPEIIDEYKLVEDTKKRIT